jgi:hypothetical protein
MDKKVLNVETLWWPFGAHLLHTKFAYIYALKNNYHFFYKYNTFPVFYYFNVSIEHFYEPISTINENEVFKSKKDIVEYKNITVTDEDKWIYKPDEIHSVKEFHQYVLKKIYKPNEMVKTHINNNQLYRKLIDEKIKYIGMHVRLSDKTNGTFKETEYIDLHNYLDKCLELCNEHSIKVIVICSDTIDGLNYILDYNKTLNNNITIIFNTEENRCLDNWQESVVYRTQNLIATPEEMKQEYLTAFINFEYLLNAYIIVGNWDSCFILMATEYRQNPLDVNINTNNPPKWGAPPLIMKTN